ncbi:hypothetical protein NM688_g8089 [Phlebia brevispora]|uniref:Uncharacterized protein n=1 Tax=Phlebia brevispora TaxID=194682 RepID=A0ACC1RXG5_9APHY|nr:hypothetical protein NM688_g8089 [Phlebia brevispora]
MTYEASMLNCYGSEVSMVNSGSGPNVPVHTRSDDYQTQAQAPKVQYMIDCHPDYCYLPTSVMKTYAPATPWTTSCRTIYPSDEEIAATLGSPSKNYSSKIRSNASGDSGDAPSFQRARKQLIQDAYVDTIAGREFNDVKFRVFSSRSRKGRKSKPLTVHARSAILDVASPKLREYLAKPGSAIRFVDRRGPPVEDDDYEDDSDFSECEEDDDTGHRKAVMRCTDLTYPAEMVSPISARKVSSPRNLLAEGKYYIACKRGTQAYHVAAYVGSIVGSRVYSDGVATPKVAHSAPFRAEREECFSDQDMEDYCTDFSEEVRSLTPVSTSTLSSPVASSGDSYAMGEVGEKEYVVAIEPVRPDESHVYGDDVNDALSAHADQTTETSDDSFIVRNGAHKTWQSLILYLYNDHVSFAPLRSGGSRRGERGCCSPKSVYRLASKFGLNKLQETAKEAIRAGLSEQNIVHELFSDFTWRYPEIIAMEVAVFRRLSSHPKVQSDWEEMSRRVSAGALPKSSGIIASLLMQ